MRNNSKKEFEENKFPYHTEPFQMGKMLKRRIMLLGIKLTVTWVGLIDFQEMGPKIACWAINVKENRFRPIDHLYSNQSNEWNETITLAGKGLSWKCAHFMQIRWKCVHFLALSGKCTHFQENAHILCKLDENAHIFLHFQENARIFRKMCAFYAN